MEIKANDFKKRVLEPEIYKNDIDMALKDNAYKEAKKQEKEEMLENTMPENGGIGHPRILTYVLVSINKAYLNVFVPCNESSAWLCSC